MRIKIDKKKCSGCRLCEMVCSLFHGGVINPQKSAVRIKSDDMDTSMNVPVVCRQCKDMKCLEGEETNARREKKKFLWDHSRAQKCPFHALPVFDGCAYHCDLCGGNPRCLKVCTPNALHL
jgi:anaerobic carbon-monoxide dehydrogenase iron sulfur subunit